MPAIMPGQAAQLANVAGVAVPARPMPVMICCMARAKS